MRTINILMSGVGTIFLWALWAAVARDYVTADDIWGQVYLNFLFIQSVPAVIVVWLFWCAVHD